VRRANGQITTLKTFSNLQPPIELVLVQNWFDELKARVPTK
jgi:hypothetical protein